ncbi:DUF397 domain-containing protein [Streptosporangium sp. NPDC051022]|uniref:DUF397 domain-containing protein n=1 Tax=Streptosporangium sp. NPDC051022 TaxID=3155752 RepID=UPI00341534DA
MDFSQATWRKSSRSQGTTDNCVEIAFTSDLIGVRDSKDRHGPILAFSPDGWQGFIDGIKNGEFNELM